MKNRLYLLTILIVICISLMGCSKKSVCDFCGEKKTCTEIIVEGKKYNLCDACQNKILSENLAHLDEKKETSSEVAEEVMTEEIVDAVQETAPTDNLQPSMQSDDLQDVESMNDHSEPVVLSFEEELLYGHCWGETNNEYKTKGEAEIMLGYPVAQVDQKISDKNGLYQIGYHWIFDIPADKEAIKQICVDALGEPSEEDHREYYKCSWYVGSLHFYLGLPSNTAHLSVSNDRYSPNY